MMEWLHRKVVLEPARREREAALRVMEERRYGRVGSQEWIEKTRSNPEVRRERRG